MCNVIIVLKFVYTSRKHEYCKLEHSSQPRKFKFIIIFEKLKKILFSKTVLKPEWLVS